ncbi:MAG TPA: methylated-DNA--[protein]-cysteine S-methyltransferase [Nitrospira sp.]|nr:methylated-DNA--[protein]-cysteine S-methyltransferase [Nitrospira sp.]
MTIAKGGEMPVTPATAWKAVLNHDRRFDGSFVYAVSSTGVYCRPSCPSRRPRRSGVTFYESPQMAEAAGFRACLRCAPRSPHRSRGDKSVEQARRHLDRHPDEPTSLTSLAQLVGLNPFHLQRVFTRTVGVSPKVYAHGLRLRGFREALRRGHDVTTASYEAGFGSSSRATEQASRDLGMTPSSFRAGGAGLTLYYATLRTPVGLVQMAATDRGLASVMLGDSGPSLVAQLRREYPKARLHRQPKLLHHYRTALLRYLEGKPLTADVRLDLHATTFQLKVWQALQRIPSGSTRTYREIAQTIDQPTASRAVARACATNPLAILIPCHRVVREDGGLAGYRWGLRRKHALLRLEADGGPSGQTADGSRANQSVKARRRSATESTPIIVPSAVTGK